MSGTRIIGEVDTRASANGYLLEVGEHELVASWAAPYFSLVLDDAEDPAPPMLFHCETLEDARGKRGITLDQHFGRL